MSLTANVWQSTLTAAFLELLIIVGHTACLFAIHPWTFQSRSFPDFILVFFFYLRQYVIKKWSGENNWEWGKWPFVSSHASAFLWHCSSVHTQTATELHILCVNFQMLSFACFLHPPAFVLVYGQCADTSSFFFFRIRYTYIFYVEKYSVYHLCMHVCACLLITCVWLECVD